MRLSAEFEEFEVHHLKHDHSTTEEMINDDISENTLYIKKLHILKL